VLRYISRLDGRRLHIKKAVNNIESLEIMKKNITDSINIEFSVGETIAGYQIIRKIYLEELKGFFYELEHKSTGAKHIHISNNDKENTFGVAFKTVPSDSTGVAHILEHTALCGSRKFTVRDPFFSMIKRSLNTFMNAFTASDWTMYPFSTQNEKDYRNLMDVYLDAAFFPKLDDLSFKQEGHRVEFEGEDENSDRQLVYKGVVYNEMKGAMSSPSQVMGRAMLNALYPTTTYGWNSGGDPKIIPHLTLDQLIEFHKKHYHPSNAYFYTYGDLPLKETLSIIDEKVLSSFSQIDPDTIVPNEVPWKEARVVNYSYPLDKSEDLSKKCQVSVGWLTADITDSFEVLVLALLNHILIGNSASPLRKALVDSKIGSSLCDATGFDADNRDTMFACGLKDVDEKDAKKIESIILDTLSELVGNGIDQELIDTAIHQIEFRQKEVTNTPYPYGIKCLLRISGSWFHGGDALASLQLDSDFKRLDDEITKGSFFEDRIKQYFINNKHRVLLILAPDQALEEKELKEVRKELDLIEKNMSATEIEKVNSDAAALKQLQDSEEDLSCLPTLKIDDISSNVKVVNESTEYSSTPASCYKQPTSGVFYYTSVSGIGAVPERVLPLIPFFCLSFTKLGTKKRDYSGLARLISSATGGIGMAAHARTGFDGTGKCRPFISFGGKCLNRKQDDMFKVLLECISDYSFFDLDRMKTLLIEYRSALESSVVQNGHALAISNAAQYFSETCRLNEMWNGIEQVLYIKELSEKLNDTNDSGGMEKLKDDFYLIAETLLSGENFRYALIGEDEMIQSATQGLLSIADILGVGSNLTLPAYKMATQGTEALTRKGWATNTAVSFVGTSFKTVAMGHDDAPGLAVISKILRSNYLHREIREKGGAYGGFSAYNSEDGNFSFGSYRDPHICNTLNVFENAGGYLKNGSYTDDDVTESILQIASVIDKPDTPGTAAKKAFYRKILMLPDEMRVRYKQQLLNVRKNDIARLSEKYFEPGTVEMSASVISGAEKLDSANKKLGNKPLKISRI